MKRMTDAEILAVCGCSADSPMGLAVLAIGRQVESAAYERAIEAISKKTDHLDTDTGEWGSELAIEAVKELLVSAP